MRIWLVSVCLTTQRMKDHELDYWQSASRRLTSYPKNHQYTSLQVLKCYVHRTGVPCRPGAGSGSGGDKKPESDSSTIEVGESSLSSCVLLRCISGIIEPINPSLPSKMRVCFSGEETKRI